MSANSTQFGQGEKSAMSSVDGVMNAAREGGVVVPRSGEVDDISSDRRWTLEEYR